MLTLHVWPKIKFPSREHGIKTSLHGGLTDATATRVKRDNVYATPSLTSRLRHDTPHQSHKTIHPSILNLYLDVITASYLAIYFPAEQTGERRAKACVLTVTVNANGEQGPSGAVVTYEALDRGRGTRTWTCRVTEVSILRRLIVHLGRRYLVIGCVVSCRVVS